MRACGVWAVVCGAVVRGAVLLGAALFGAGICGAMSCWAFFGGGAVVSGGVVSGGVVGGVGVWGSSFNRPKDVKGCSAAPEEFSPTAALVLFLLVLRFPTCVCVGGLGCVCRGLCLKGMLCGGVLCSKGVICVCVGG